VPDGVYNDFRDRQGFEQECKQAAIMGFDGKTLIHPGQIAAANKALLPSQEAITNAQAIIAAPSVIRKMLKKELYPLTEKWLNGCISQKRKNYCESSKQPKPNHNRNRKHKQQT